MNHSPSDFSSSDFSSSDDDIETAAAEWLCERDEGFAPGRAAAFAAWRAADPRHEAAARDTEQAMALITEMPAVREPLESRCAEESRPPAGARRGGGWRAPAWAMGLAAALMLAAGVWWVGPWRPEATRHYVTAAARQQQIALNDGSVVNLNVSSDVSVRLSARERRVTLSAGEAHFAVAHDAARPFIVTAAGVSVRAVGTAFSVRLDGADVAVLVTEGKVEVTRAGEGTGPEATPAGARPRLEAGQRMSIRRDGSATATKTETVSAGALQAAIRWHSQVMTFSDLPLREVVAQFNRRNETQLVFADAALGERKIGGTFAADQVEAFARLLAQDGDLVAERRGAREIQLRRAP